MKKIVSDAQQLSIDVREGALVIECAKITLSQQCAKNRVTYSAAGRIIQDKKGCFYICMSYKCKKSSSPFLLMTSSALSNNTPTGTVFPKSYYFSMVAVSVDGKIWRGEDIWLEADCFWTTRTAVVKAECSVISNVAVHRDSPAVNYYEYTVNVKDFLFPRNEFTDYGDGKLRNVSVFGVGRYSCRLKIHESYISLFISSEKRVDKKVCDAILKSIEIITGTPLKPTVTVSRNRFNSFTKIEALDMSEQDMRLPPPIPNRHPGQLNNCALYIKLMVKKIANEQPLFYQYWQELCVSQTASIESFSLCVSVNVEGMVNEYFPHLRRADPEFVQECHDAAAILRGLLIGAEIKPRVQEKIFHSLASAKTPSVKNALYSIFEKNAVDKWSLIRHPAAHGTLSQKKFNTQQLLDCSYSCIFMFYEMLARHIGFNGGRIDYSSGGHPRLLCDVQD
ncbi:hypothetical protein [Pseudomonas sp. NPDC085632]|uniref:hypothetical protein n=1 Tax=Pseudomonas sp. NPDC085632 TaxID=3364429 RepID=UPI0037C9BBC1